MNSIKVLEEDATDVNVEATNCCGLYEIYNLSNNPWGALIRVVQDCNNDYNLMIFHDAVRYKNGQKLFNLIRRHNLGKVVASKKVNNPNSNNIIRMWTFYPDWVKMHLLFDNLELIDYSYYKIILPKNDRTRICNSVRS